MITYIQNQNSTTLSRNIHLYAYLRYSSIEIRPDDKLITLIGTEWTFQSHHRQNMLHLPIPSSSTICKNEHVARSSFSILHHLTSVPSHRPFTLQTHWMAPPQFISEICSTDAKRHRKNVRFSHNLLYCCCHSQRASVPRARVRVHYLSNKNASKNKAKNIKMEYILRCTNTIEIKCSTIRLCALCHPGLGPS